MIEFFTALIIDYQVQEQDMRSVIWFDTYGQCEKVLRSGGLDVIYEDPKDIVLMCHKSEWISRSKRPKLRPEEESDG